MRLPAWNADWWVDFLVNYVAFALTIILNFLPGLLFSFAVFKHTSLNRWDKVLFGLVFSVIVIPLLLFLEFMAIGLKFNFMLFFANALLVSIVSIALLAYQKHKFEFKFSASSFSLGLDGDAVEFLKKNAVGIILIVMMFAGFYIRFSSAYSPVFFEFDPIFYDKITEKLVTNGFVEEMSPESYYPEQLFVRVPPMLHYMEASWYTSYATLSGSSYLKETLMKTAQFYPPLVGALLCFLVFLILREEYNEYIGLVVAGIFAFMPQLVKKFAAGVSEQQPLGLFALMLVFALYILAISRKSNRFAVLAGLSTAVVILSSQQYIWPFMVLTAYIALQSILDYLSGTLDSFFIKANAVAVAGALAGSFLLSTYGSGSRFEIFSTNILVMIAALAFSALLYGATRFLKEHHKEKKQRFKIFAGVSIVSLIVLFLSPLGERLLGMVRGQLGIAFAQGALGKTIQEEGATNPAFFQPSFAILNPPLVLLGVTILASLVAILVLLERKHRNYAIVFAFITTALLVFNNQVDSIMKFIAGAVGSEPLTAFVNFFASSDVFLYLATALIATSLYYLFSEKKSRTSLLFMLIFFPVAYIGINKVKYLLHLGFAVAMAFGFVLGESLRVFDLLGRILKLENVKQYATYFLYLVILVGAGVVYVEAQTAPDSMNELKFTRIPGDWVLASELTPSFTGTPQSAMGWLYHNTNRFNPVIQQQCNAQHGWDCRVLSWWDYGHWTTFFGDSNTVLDPNNNHPEFDQETARAFVNGNPSDLAYTMKFHHGTHVLVDSDLIGKWGALVFLSGTCTKSQSPTCPEKPEIDFTTGTGGSKYEAEHYYEYLTVSQETCPSSASAVPLPMLKNSFGITYCADNEYLYVLTSKGLLPGYKRKFVLTATPSSIANPDANVSYLVPIAKDQFLNLNPDLSYGQLNNRVFYSAFTRLFFFEQLPGFKLVFRSPGGSVRIFEYTGDEGASAFTPTPSPSPSATPIPSPSESATPSPSPYVNATNQTGAGGNNSNSSK